MLGISFLSFPFLSFPIVGAGGAQSDFQKGSHMQPLGSHLLRQHLGQVSASGCQVAA